MVERDKIATVAELNVRLTAVERATKQLGGIQRYQSYPPKSISVNVIHGGDEELGAFEVEAEVLKPLLDQYADYLRKKLEALGVKL